MRCLLSDYVTHEEACYKKRDGSIKGKVDTWIQHYCMSSMTTGRRNHIVYACATIRSRTIWKALSKAPNWIFSEVPDAKLYLREEDRGRERERVYTQYLLQQVVIILP